MASLPPEKKRQILRELTGHLGRLSLPSLRGR